LLVDESKITTPAQLDAAIESQRVARLAAEQKADRIRAYIAWIPLALGAVMIALIVAAHYLTHLISPTIYIGSLLLIVIMSVRSTLARRARRSAINSD
jgi:uncharacterized membrane protein YoaK (UPF0700 family)